jgi:hypothetical protein
MSSWRRVTQLPPLWARWLLAAGVAVAVIVSIVIAIDRAGPESPTSEAGAELEDNRVADIAITEDQAPHSAGLAAGAGLRSALQRAIAGDIRGRISQGRLTGPLEGVSCSAAGTAVAGRSPYRCTARSANIDYPFVAVFDERRRLFTWCKVDQQPQGETSSEIPISASCRA